MTDFWRATAKHWCAVCEVWVAGHARNVAVHNASAAHKHKAEQAVRTRVVEQREADAAANAVADQIRVIEAAARAAMVGAPPPAAQSDDIPFSAANLFYTKPITHAEKLRQRDELAAFIRQKVEQRQQKDKDDHRSSPADLLTTYRYVDPVFFPSVDELPESIKAIARDPAGWKQEIHEMTGLPIWYQPALNVYVWSEPLISEPLNSEPANSEPANSEPVESRKAEEVVPLKTDELAPAEREVLAGASAPPRADLPPGADSPPEAVELTLEMLVNRARMRTEMTGAGIPGEWVTTTESGMLSVRAPRVEAELESRTLDDVLEAEEGMRKAATDYRSGLDAADNARGEREVRRQVTAPKETGFRKRRLV